MNPDRTVSPRSSGILARASVLALGIAMALPIGAAPSSAAQPQAKGAAIQLDASPGTRATYRVREQLAGIDFPDDAVGTTDAVTGILALMPDGSVDSSKSKLIIDLRALKSDQEGRDNAVRNRVLETDKFPNAEFVPKKLVGAPNPLPAPDKSSEQSGFKLTGDLTIHGVTKEVTLVGYATYAKDQVAGHATVDFTFDTFGLTKIKLARVLSIDDKIQLELDFRFKRS